MIKIYEQSFCENCFADCNEFPCKNCGFNGVDAKRDAMALPYGAVLQGKYIIGKMLGKGGFGITYLAYDYSKKARVAIKEYYPSGLVYRQPGEIKLECSPNKEEIFKEGEERFYEEAKTIAKLNTNENIVTVYEFFKENNTSYFVMEYLEGCDLKGYVQNEALSEGQAVSVIKAVCNALGEAHEKDVLHRDISPDNIFICNDGRIMLIDFGAARQLAAEKSQSMSVILKQGFAPIEQYQRKSHHGPWSDVYALGATIYYALVRDVPDDAITRMASPGLDFSKNPSVSDGFKNILSKMMAVNVSDRYADTNEVLKDLEGLDIPAVPLVIPSKKASDVPTEREVTKRETTVPNSEKLKEIDDSDNKENKKEEKKEKKSILPFAIGAVLLIVIVIVIILLAKGCSDNSAPSGDAGGEGGGNGDTPLKTEYTEKTDVPDDTDVTEETDFGTSTETSAETSDKTNYIPTGNMFGVNNPAYGSVTCESDEAPLGSKVKIKAVPNTGYKFTGWSDGEKTQEREVEVSLRNLYTAEFEPVTVKVSFSEGSFAPLNVTYGEVYGTLPTPSRTDGIFVGWFDAQTGGSMVTSGSTVLKAEDHTLYARYDQIVLDHLRITSSNHKTSYIVGERLDTSNLKLTAVYSDGSEKTVTGFTTNPANGTTVTQSMNKVTVSYEGKTVDYGISVASEQATKIEVVSLPSKTTYYEGDKFSTSGLSVKVTYNNGRSETKSSGFATTPSNGAVLASSNTTVSVSYGGKTTSFAITVIKVEPSSITVSTPPSKVSYFAGDKLNTAGLSIEVTYNNGTSETLYSGFTTSPANGATLSTSNTKVTVSYEGKTATQSITVKEIAVTSISISAKPKTEYYDGDALSTSGLKINVIYNNGTNKVVSSGFTTSPANGATLSTSNTKVTVSYEGKTTSYTISVTPLTVTSISVSSNPAKTSYYEGDTLSTSGLKINVNYNNGTTKTISSGFTTSPANGATLSTSNTKVTVSYEGKTTSYNISVVNSVILSGDGYTLMADGTLTITNDNAMKDYSSSSDRPWNSQRSSIKKVVIQSGVTRIGKFAFYDCDSITTVTIPNSVTSIGSNAFWYCGSLMTINASSGNANYTSVDGVLFNKNKTTLIQYPCGKQGAYTIPDSVTSIGNYAFNSCNALKSVTIPNSVTSIGSDAFRGCVSLTTVTISNGVTSIGSYAFYGCDSLTSITIPYSVTSIGSDAFWYCGSLTAINVSSGNANYTSVDGVLFNKNNTTLIQYPCGKQGAYTIPDSVTSIGSSAFLECASLTSITIPDSVTSIGSDAFRGCVSLTSITIPDSVTSIRSRAFLDCYSLTSITIPNSVTSIGEDAFLDCDSLTSITIPDSVTSIGSGAFAYCDSLTSVTIGNSVTSIGSDAFASCDSLTSVTIPNSVTSIGSEAFEGCDSLQTINFKGTQAQWNAITKGTDWDRNTGDYTINYLG